MEVAQYRERYLTAVEHINNKAHTDKQQELFVIATELVIETQKISVSFLQRSFHLGYNQAQHLMEKLESEKVVSAAANNGTRTVLIK